jgi:hypothetical protein
MALPTKSDVQTMKYSKDGTPWIQVSPKPAVDPNTMAYSKNGTPWWGVPDSTPPPTPTTNSNFFMMFNHF